MHARSHTHTHKQAHTLLNVFDINEIKKLVMEFEDLMFWLNLY